jgi:hypothetical protein
MDADCPVVSQVYIQAWAHAIKVPRITNISSVVSKLDIGLVAQPVVQ